MNLLRIINKCFEFLNIRQANFAKPNIYYTAFVFFFISIFYFPHLKAQTSAEDFGTNRVQYKDFIWSYYTTERFTVYFYLGGQELGKFVVMDASAQMDDVEKSLEYRLQDPIDILVYNNLGDLKQSNIGRGIDINNTGGVTKIIGNKIFVYFNGDHQQLRAQIREGIAAVCLQNMMYGGSIQEVLQNAVLLNLPNWYSLGLSSYVGESWSAEMDASLRDPILTGKFKNINKLDNNQAVLAGHSFWHYVALTYGKATIPNILYLTRINHNIEAGFAYVVGKSLSQVLDEWYNFYFDYYTKNNLSFADNKENLLPLKTHKRKTYTQFAINTTADKVAYVLMDNGLYKVRIKDLEKKKTKKMLRGGYRDINMPVDATYPMLAWDLTGKVLAMIYERRAKTYLVTYDTEEKKKTKKLIANFQKIVSFSFGENSNQLVLSAINRGQSDIYTFGITSSKVTQITNDFWDDLNPAFVKLYNRQGILFSSNRPDDTIRNTKQIDSLLPVKPMDLFFYNTKTNSKALVQVTNTPHFNESYPTAFDNKYFSYLSQRNKVNNRNIAYIDSVFHHYDYYYYFPDSTAINPKYNIDSLRSVNLWKPDSMKQIPVFKDVAHSFALTSNSVGMTKQFMAYKKKIMIEQYMNKGKPLFYLNKISDDIPNETEINFADVDTNSYSDNKILTPVNDSTMVKKDSSTTPVTEKYESVFQSEFSFSPTPENNNPNTNPNEATLQTQPVVINQKDDSQRRNYKTGIFKFGKVLPYSVKFSTEYLVSQLDNGLIVNRYQSYSTGGGQFQNPNLGALIRLGISDLFEDYRITGGFRLPTNISGSEYFITYEDFKHRLDKKYTYYRKVRNESYDFSSVWILPVNSKVKTNFAEVQFRYPLDFNRSFRGIISYRQEKIVFQATDTFSLNLANYIENWAAVRGEYVFDNTLKVQLNILNGTRYKIYFDAQKLLDQKNLFLFATGIDLRHYEKIHRQIVWATRFNFSTSWGDAKIAYLLGGIDNWILPKTTATDPNTTDQTTYAFQTLSTNLRGFPQGARKGNSAMVLNEELRFPVFSYLSKSPIRSEFVKNFQLIGFYDIGTAWLGFSPYSEDNPFNTKIITRPPIVVKVNYFREPIIMGFGGGVRTTLFGYFIRVDYARGLDSGELKAPIWYFSLGTDF